MFSFLHKLIVLLHQNCLFYQEPQMFVYFACIYFWISVDTHFELSKITGLAKTLLFY